LGGKTKGPAGLEIRGGHKVGKNKQTNTCKDDEEKNKTKNLEGIDWFRSTRSEPYLGSGGNCQRLGLGVAVCVPVVGESELLFVRCREVLERLPWVHGRSTFLNEVDETVGCGGDVRLTPHWTQERLLTTHEPKTDPHRAVIRHKGAPLRLVA
jgi:hypothetical protein